MKPIISAAFALVAATGSSVGETEPHVGRASVELPPCSLPGTGLTGNITLANDIGDSGKRPAPQNAAALFRRPVSVQRVGAAARIDRQAFDTMRNRLVIADPSTGTRQILRTDASSRTVIFVDAASNQVLSRISLGGEPASALYDPTSGCVLVSVPERGQVVAIDPGSATIARTFTLPGGDRPVGMLLDAAERLLFVAGDSSATVEVVNLKSMQVMDVASTGAPVRELALDAAWHRVYVVAGDGRVSGYDLRRSRLLRTGVLDQASAIGIAVDPRTHTVYVTTTDGDQRRSLQVLEGVAPAPPRCVFHHSVPGSPCLAKYALTR